LISFCIFFLSSSEIASFNSAYFLLISSSILPNEPSLYCGLVTLVVVTLGVLPVFLPLETVDDVLPDEVLPLDDEVPPDGLLPPTAPPTSLSTVILVDATFKPNHLLKSAQTPYIF
jgi:hypothetical protein